MTEAWLFPGQGAQRPDMLEGHRDAPQFAERYEAVCDALGEDPLRRPDALERNAVSSLLTVLASTLALDRWREQAAEPAGYAGYSVGQWTALHAAGAVSFLDLVMVLKRRADLMDACFARDEGAMMAVIGVPHETVEGWLDDLRRDGSFLQIANYNCLGQVSVAGTRTAVGRALAEVDRIRPKKAMLLPVRGAWHCGLLEPAAAAFRDVLDDVTLAPQRAVVMDNTTGEPLPDAPGALRDSLARHLARPVLWDACVKGLAARGCTDFVELGWGDTLTKFGFFIDRRLRHRAFYR